MEVVQIVAGVLASHVSARAMERLRVGWAGQSYLRYPPKHPRDAY
jgi:hypothetical protein